MRPLLSFRTARMTVRLHREFPENGWRWALDNALLIRRFTLELVNAEPLTELERFEVDVLADIACLPEVAQ